MEEKLPRARELCLEQAQSFIQAAEHLNLVGWPHIVYHLSLLALEEVGKANMLGVLMLGRANLSESWIERALNSHQRKLQWAVWSPITRIDPADFKAAHEFAERAHAMRLASLYVDAKANLAEPAPSEQVRTDDALQALSLARARLDYERERGVPTGEIDDLTKWFLDTMADPQSQRLLLSDAFRAKFEAMNGDVRGWAEWARDEFARLDQEARDTLEAELARPGVPKELATPRWRANASVYTPSHSLKAKVLARWNERIEPVQLLWSGKKDEFTLQITLDDSEPMSSLTAKLIHLTKLTVACLNIGTIGYFWFQRSGFEQKIFKDIRDLKLSRPLEIGRGESFWGDGRAVALTEEHIDHAIHCMLAFAPLTEEEAEPIFKPYYEGLALIAKSDMFFNFDALARRSFVASLAGALRHYGDWSGKPEEFAASFHEQFAPFMPDREHRDQMYPILTPEGDPSETSLANLRSAKQLADLYLIHSARRTWRTILDRARE